MNNYTEKQLLIIKDFKDIENAFSLDLQNTSRSLLVKMIRYVVFERYQHEDYKTLCEPFLISQQTVSSTRKQLKKIVDTEIYDDFKIAVESLDNIVMNRCIDKHIPRRWDLPKIEVVKSDIPKMKTPEIMAILRRKKDSPLWNKRISEWNYRDFQELKKIE